MQKRYIDFKIKGMRRDMSSSKADPSFAYEIFNMRLTPIAGETTLSLVNEKGNSLLPLATSEGSFSIPNWTYVGHCVINQYLVLFVLQEAGTENETEAIYRIDFGALHTIDNVDYYDIKLLFRTHNYNRLNFVPEELLETIGDYETENVIKVYFTDGHNQPRVINIMKDYYHPAPAEHAYNSDELNFVRSLKFNETVTITKQESAGALFSAGVIQYALTYFDKNAQETNIFYVSPLYYISSGNRGNSPEETVGNAFNISVSNLDVDFDYVRIYSIRRTSLEAQPIVKRVVDIPVVKVSNSASLSYTDTNTSGEAIDPTVLYYVGGDCISAKTFEAKDNTLFLGNLEMLRELPKTTSGDLFKANVSPIKDAGASSLNWGLENKEISINTIDPSVGDATYNYESLLGLKNSDITVFKTHEIYRLGYQLQHKSGVWTDAYWIKDYEINFIPTTTQTKAIFKNITFTLNDVNGTIDKLLSQGYTAIRPVIVYPKASDRRVLCQGMICPTVFNLKDRYDNNIYAQASWFARPIPYVSSGENEDRNSAAVEYRHNQMLKPSSRYGNEIQCMDTYPPSAGTTDGSINNMAFWTGSQNPFTGTYSNEYSDYYFVDNSVVTLNTPELDFDESFMLNNDSTYTFNIVGAIPIHATTSDISILASAPFEGDTCSVVTNLRMPSSVKLGAINKKFSMTGENGWKHSPIYQQWIERKVLDLNTPVAGSDNDMYQYQVFGAYISPWHKTGQFSPTQKRLSISEKHLAYMEPQYTASVLKQKKLSHLQFSYNTCYLNAVDSYPKSGKEAPAIITYNSNEATAERIRVPEYSFGRYYGNIDKVLAPGTNNGGSYFIRSTNDSFVFNAQQNFPDNMNNLTVISPIGNISVDEEYSAMLNNTSIAALSNTSGDPIHIKYKSTPHIVVSLSPTQGGDNNPQKTILPFFNGKPALWPDSGYSDRMISQAIPSINLLGGYGYIWLGEIWNDNVSNRFGGNSEEALIANDWVVGGKAVPLEYGCKLTWDRGDTYYQRYDCLKTYPFTLEDENSIVEVVSFMCETRINIDGRYDRNRGTASLVAHPTNFNLLNPVYSQKDNFFTYHGFNSQNNVEKFPNQITWTLTKSPNALVDRWTNMNLASTLNLDGDRGEIQRIEKYRNDLFAFQNSGISKILYNERTVLSTQSGIPVELANSARVDGKVYFTELEGLTNRQSIKVTPNGIYFIDGKTKSAYLFNGQQCVSLSDTKAMKIFFDGEPDNFKIFYDSKEKDVYFVNSNCCLCFSEKLGEFAGFFSYQNTPMMDSVGPHFLSINPDNSILYEQYTGEYNSFYGVIRPHSITFNGNDGMMQDKIYTNLDFIADSFLEDTYVTTKTFDHIKAWDEYQSGSYSLVNTIGRPSNLKKKFRIWRAQIPRAKWNGRDRMRNPWCLVKLAMNNPSTYKTILHQASLEYYM